MKNPLPSAFLKLLTVACLLTASPLFANYHLTFNDEFDSFDSSRWQTSDFWGMRNNPGDYQNQWFCDPNSAPSGFTAFNPFIPTGSGNLIIQARPTPAGAYSNGLPYVSGQLSTAHKFTQRYGYFELRAKLPPGKGLWHRFWFLTDDGVWPGEYDVFEVLGKENPVTVHHTTHYRDALSSRGVDGFASTGINPVDGNFHNYGFHWTPETVTWYVDGQKVMSQPNRINIPMYTLIDVTVGNDPRNEWPGNPDATTPWPANMELEYFRVYSNDPSLPRVSLPSGTSHAAPPIGSGITFTDTQPTTPQLPPGWTAGDIVPVGARGSKGSSAWNSHTGEWMVKGSGINNGGLGDGCQFTGTPLTGDGGVVATVRNVTAMNDNDVTAGVMIRESNNYRAREIALLSNTSVNNPNTGGSLVLLSRSATDGSATSLATIPNISAPVSLRIMRSGNSFTAAYSTNDGQTWTTVGTPQTLAMGSTAQAGLAVAGDPSVFFRLSRSTFSNVSVGQFAPLLTASATSVLTSQTIQCSASLINQLTGSIAATGQVTWSVASGGGTIDSNGIYTAPALMGTGKALIKAVFGNHTVTRPIDILLPNPWKIPSVINSPPGDAGFASNLWTLIGGGNGISTSGKVDGFRFLSSSINGNDTVTVKLTSSNASQAGLVIRDATAFMDGFVGARGRYAGIWRTPTGLQWATRETQAGSGNLGNAVSRTTNNITTLPIWLRLERSGVSSDTFKAFYSTNGTAFTQLGSSRIFPMTLPASAGLAVATGNRHTTATATFSDLSVGSSSSDSPTVATPASASPNPVTGNTTNLSVLGADESGEAALIYTWSASGPAPVTFSINDTNGAKNATATFTRGGTYSVTATITDEGGSTTTSSFILTVSQVLTGITTSPATVSVGTGATQQFTANGIDQFGQAMPASATWTLTSGTGTINSSTGLYTAPATVGAAVVTAVAGPFSATSAITITVSTALPSPWVGTDIGSTPVGNSTYLEDTWTATGGGSAGDPEWNLFGTGINGSKFSESFRFVNQPVNGDGTLIVRLIDIGGAAQAGLMIRESTARNSRYTGLFHTNEFTLPGLAWMSRITVNGFAVLHNTQISTTFPVWLRLVRSGNTITASRKSDAAADWTQIGTQTVALNSNSLVGFVISSGSAVSTATATFSNLSFTPTVNTPPTVATPAAATPNTVTGATANLSVSGADNAGEPALTYTWSASGPAPVTFSINGTNAAKNTTATFTRSGDYAMTATITDQGGLTTTSSLNLIVSQVLTGITTSPATVSVGTSATQQFTANGIDQFGQAMPASATWTLTSGTGTINSSTGLYTAPATGGAAVVTAVADSFSATSAVTITVSTALPSPWVGTDINSMPVGNSTYLEGTWTATGGGSAGDQYGLSGTGINGSKYSDSFRFVNQPITGDGTLIVRITDIGTAAQAGLMVRESTAKNSRYTGLFHTTEFTLPGLAWMSRSTVNGFAALHNTQISTTFPVWLRLVRSGNTFTASRKSDAAADWTQIGTQTIALNSTSLVGFVVSSGTAVSKATATFSDLSFTPTGNTPPTLAIPAAATPNTVTAVTTNLSVLGADNAGESILNYSWSETGPAAVTYSANGSNGAKTTTVTFARAGTYTFTATITDGDNLTTTSSVNVTVNQTLTSNPVAPATTSINSGTTQQFTTSGYDQFGTVMLEQPAFNWSLTSGVGSINPSGLYTAPNAAGSASIRASHGSVNASAAISVISTMNPFDTWMSDYPLLTASEKTVDADPDGDGVNNLLEFALGGLPNTSSNRGYQMGNTEDTNGNGQQELTLTLAVRNSGGSATFTSGTGGIRFTVVDGVKYTIQGSGDLNFPTGAVSEAPAPAGLPILPAGYEYRRFRLSDSEGLSGKGFLRVQVESAP